MANDNMTIRFTPDGFSFAECPDSASVILDDAPLHEVAPGPDFQKRLQEELLNLLPVSAPNARLSCQFISSRVLLLPSEVTSQEMAELMYHSTLSELAEEEQVLIQSITLPNEQQVNLCFGINRSLYLFLQRNYDNLSFEHHLSSLLIEGCKMANGNCLVVRCDSQNLELALYRDQKLTLANVYHTSQPENRSYYVMNTWLQQGLNQLTDHLLVLSRNNEGLQIRASLHRFIKHVFS